MNPKLPRPPLDRSLCLALAEEILSRAPARPWIVRAEPKGDLVCSFVLPLELCHPQQADHMRRRPLWAIDAERKELRSIMESQFVRQLPRDRTRFYAIGGGAHPMLAEPLPGRPQVRAIRFSSQEPDVNSNWAKQTIDLLVAHRVVRSKAGLRHRGALGLIVDDRPACADVVQSWEFLTRKEAGFVMLEIRTGSAIENA